MKIITMHHILGNKVLEYDVDDRGVIVDEREYDRTVNPKPNIADWVKEHMVFWYDMSKPVDTYIPGVTYANPFVNGGGKLTYDNAINKCIITHTPTNNNNIAFWQIFVKPLQYVESYKIRVTGLPEGFTMKGRLGYDSIQITSDGEYDIPEYKNSSTTNSSYHGFYLAGDNVNDVDCNIVVEEIPTRQSVPTNEILKANPYLQDFSGNNRPLKLNNFLFAAMSGVGGYETNFSEEVYPNALVTDGVDDYGVVENLQQGVKVLFMTAIPLGLYKTWYAQDSFSIYGQPGITAYNFRNTGGVTYLDGILNEAEISNNLLNKKQIVTIVNPTDGGNNSIMFFNSYGSSYMNMAFYGSIGFDSVPTQQTDGFTEQDLIDYVLENLITK
jgi:hypothetical protein